MQRGSTLERKKKKKKKRFGGLKVERRGWKARAGSGVETVCTGRCFNSGELCSHLIGAVIRNQRTDLSEDFLRLWNERRKGIRKGDLKVLTNEFLAR